MVEAKSTKLQQFSNVVGSVYCFRIKCNASLHKIELSFPTILAEEADFIDRQELTRRQKEHKTEAEHFKMTSFLQQEQGDHTVEK